MFAFCTLTNQKVCGISDSTSTDMGIIADFETQTISANSMRYTEGIAFARAATRSYDSCYYEVGADVSDEMMQSLVEQQTTKMEIQVTFTKNTEMNVYIYGGQSRNQATESITENNEPIELGKTYSIDYQKGFLVVAYPNYGKPTEFEFTYKLEATKPDPVKKDEVIEIVPVAPAPGTIKTPIKVLPLSQEWWKGDEGEELLMLVGAGAGGVFLLCILACCCCRSSSNNKVEIIENNRVLETSPREPEFNVEYVDNRRPGAGNDTSVELEDIVDDDEMSSNPNMHSRGSNQIYDSKKGMSGSK